MTTIWIVPPGTYHLGEPSSTPVDPADLENALRVELARSTTPESLAVNAYSGVVDYDNVVLSHAACRAGVEKIVFAAEIPSGSTDPSAGPPGGRGEDFLPRPCPASTSPPDSVR
jgi:hypothetical protein